MLCNSSFRLANANKELLVKASSLENIKNNLSILPDMILLIFIELTLPIQFKYFEALIKNGIKLLQYYPDNTYLCRGLGKSFSNLLDQPFIQNFFWLEPDMKIQVTFVSEIPRAIWLIVSGKKEDFKLVVSDFNKIQGVRVDPNQDFDSLTYFLRFRATINSKGQEQLLGDFRVIAIEAYETQFLKDEVAGLILAGQYKSNSQPYGSYLDWLAKVEVDGSGVTVGVVDSGVSVLHPAFDERVKDLTNGKKGWHGTFVAGHVAGYYCQEKDRNSFIYGLGVAPGANLLSQDKTKLATKLCLETVTEVGFNGIAGTIQNNSWGFGNCNPMNYSSLEAIYDAMVRNSDPSDNMPKPLTVCFSAGNEGIAGLSRPAGAKNVIVTGNSKNYRPKDAGIEADNINEVFEGNYNNGFDQSSHGNCGDGRIRPHLVAPGQWTASAGYGLHIDRDNAKFISPKLTWSHGTSAASPKTAGACALLTEWWQKKNNGKNPSPAMLRALLISDAIDMNYNGNIPNNRQGWGRLHLGNILLAPKDFFVFIDQEVMFTRDSEFIEYRVRIVDINKPLKVTLCWTDPHGSIGSGTRDITTLVNVLSLRILIGDLVYLANNFQEGFSVPGFSDKSYLDNLQNIYINTNISEDIGVTITALKLRMNCLTNSVVPPQQDFALVISNACLV